jgi:hypothetical protein
MAITIAQFVAGENGTEIVDSAENLAAASVETFGQFSGRGVSLLIYLGNGFDKVALADAAAAIAALTAVEIAGLAGKMVDFIDVTEDAVAIDAAQALALASAGLHFDGSDRVKVADLGATIESLTTAQIADLRAVGIIRIDVDDSALVLSLAQFNAFGTAGITLAADVVMLADIGASLASLTTTEIADIGARSIAAVDATDDTLTLSLANSTPMVRRASRSRQPMSSRSPTLAPI